MLDVVFRGRNRPLLIWIAPVVLMLMSIVDLLFIFMFIESSDGFSGGGAG